MGILIYEHFLGQKFVKGTSSLILNEAKIITTSIANDLMNCSEKPEVSVLIDDGNINLLNNVNIIKRNNSKEIVDDICLNLNKNDSVLIVAPEENLELFNIVKNLEKRNVNLLNCQSNFIKTTTNKKEINNHLIKSKDYLINTFDNYKFIDENNKIIAKVFDGFGSENLFIFHNRSDLKDKKILLTDRHIYQPYHEGTIVGINIVANNGNYRILSINEQKYEETLGNTLALKKIYIGKLNSSYVLFDKFVNSILSNLEGYNGFFGIDAIITNDDKIFFLEINPRLTTSYSFLSKSLGFNPLELFYNANYDFSIENNKNFLINVYDE
ncbi:MAG: ATP-grasp domain-containing protein [Gammaproteobacteria bacterium]